MENLYHKTAVRTYSGIYFDFLNPTIDMINIEDIAHSLSNQCRFNGHLPNFYSVAQHSVHCAEMVSEPYKLQALLHDASEAYIVDIPKPIKPYLTNYKDMEDKIMYLIAEKFGFDYPFSQEVKKADEDRLIFEWENIFLAKPYKSKSLCWSNDYAKNRFLLMFDELTKKNNNIKINTHQKMTKENLKTSEEWQKLTPSIVVIDPDGWDRTNFQYSWFEEKVSLETYNARLFRSTVICKEVEPNLNYIKNEGSKQETLEDTAEKLFPFTNDDAENRIITIKRLFWIDGAKYQAERSY
jgi:5'-deoxynucleotidase YfbR-like HD superfamily hydrolase